MEENNETKTGKIMETNRCYDIDYGNDTYVNVIRKPCGRNRWEFAAGVLVTEYYGQDVRFRNEDGELVDYDQTLKKLESRDDLNGYAYENTAGDQKQYFPENLTEETPILLENEDKQIRLVPVEGPEKNDKKGDSLKEQIDYESDEASEEEQQLQEDQISMVKQFVRRRMDYT